EIIASISHDEHVLDIRSGRVAIIRAQNNLFVPPMNSVLAGRVSLNSFSIPGAGEGSPATIIFGLLAGPQNEMCLFYLRRVIGTEMNEGAFKARLAVWRIGLV